MNIDNNKFDHLLNNLEKVSFRKSIFNYEYGRKAFLSLGKGDICEWLEKLLPNTRLILEPKIIGESIGIQYINGKLNKAINKYSRDITEEVNSIRSIPKSISVNQRMELLGVLYNNKIKIQKKSREKFLEKDKKPAIGINPNFCAFQIFNCKLNQFQVLQELKNLNFEIPDNQYTNFVSDIEIYRQCWKDGKLFRNYPNNGIVMKINSRKLQKLLGENNISINWAYSIN